MTDHTTIRARIAETEAAIADMARYILSDDVNDPARSVIAKLTWRKQGLILRLTQDRVE